MNVTALYFSPTGGSKRSALSLAAALAPEGFAELDITCGAAAGDFGPGDVVVFSVPCYNGRVPEVAAGRLEQVHGHRTPCIISITYGNRDYDDSLLELQDIVQRQGFIVQGAAALVGQLRPAAVVCVDSLCSAEGQRLGRTVQFSDAGLYPTQADHTRHLTRDTVGVPVVAAGIPTLMQAQEGADLVVTPRALDSVIAHGAALLAGSVNRALQPRLTVQQLCWLTG